MVSWVLDQTKHKVRDYPEKRFRRRKCGEDTEEVCGREGPLRGNRVVRFPDNAISLHGLELALKHRVMRQLDFRL